MYRWINRLLGRTEKRTVNGWEQWLPTPTLSGITITPETALSLTAVYRCVDIISSEIASLPICVYENLPTGGRRPDYDDPRSDLIRFEPSAELTAYAFWETIVSHACLYGNGMAAITRAWDGTPLGFTLLDARTTIVKRADDGQIFYEATTELGDDRSIKQRFISDNVLHIKNIGYSGVVGYSPIRLAQESIANLAAAEKAASAAFGQSGTFVGMFKVPDDWDEEARKKFRESFNRQHQGPYNYAKIGVIDQSTDYMPLKISLEDLQYMEQRKFGVGEVARLFGVPNHMVGDLDNATYSNIEEENLQFVQRTLKKWVNRVESECNKKLFTRDERRTRYVQFDMNGVLRGNSASQMAWFDGIISKAAMSVDEFCHAVGLNPVGGEVGKTRFTSNNLIPFDPSKPDEAQPSTVEQPASPATALAAPQSDDRESQPLPPVEVIEEASRALQAVRSVVVENLQRIVRKETSALRRAAKRADWQTFAKDFYSEHRDFLTANLASSVEALSLVTGKALDVEGIVSKIVDDSQQQLQASDNVEALLDTWEASKANALYEDYLTA